MEPNADNYYRGAYQGLCLSRKLIENMIQEADLKKLKVFEDADLDPDERHRREM
jgi:hypothetical protein